MATHTAEMSIESLESRYRRDPASRIFPRLADAYREEGNIDKAIEICLNGLDLYPSNSPALSSGAATLRWEN